MSTAEKPPVIDINAVPQYLAVKRGENKMFAVPVKGFPKPVCQLLLNGQPVPEPVRLRPVETPNGIQIEMENLQPVDSGQYEMVVKNPLGEARAPFKLCVLGPPGPPKAPLNVCDLSKSGCNLRWQPPENDGGTPIINYRVEKMDLSAGEPKWEKVKDVPGSAADLIAPVKLTEGTKYKFRVIAINSEGESAPLESTKDTLARDPFDPPDPPGQPQVVDVDANLVKLKWAKPPNDNGAPVLKYIVEMKQPNESASAWKPAKEVGGPDSLDACVEGLTEGQAYEFRVRAVNKAGTGEPSAPSAAATPKAKFIKPRIDKSRLNLIKEKVGKPVRVEMNYVALPIDTLAWSVGDKPLVKESLDASMQIVDKEKQSALELPKSERRHTGVYKFLVANEMGSDEASVEVVILGIVFHIRIINFDMKIIRVCKQYFHSGRQCIRIFQDHRANRLGRSS